MGAVSEPSLSRDEELALHRRLVGDDVTATAETAQTYLDYLVHWLAITNSANIPEEYCVEAAEDALLSLFKSPASFDPNRGKSLCSFLQMSAQGDLRNILRREGRRRRKETTLESVELSQDMGKYLQVSDDPSLPLEIAEESAKVSERFLAPALKGLSEAELRVWQLLQEGERRTAVFAKAMEILHLSEEDQQAEVKRVKDKLKKRVQRAKDGDEQSP